MIYGEDNRDRCRRWMTEVHRFQGTDFLVFLAAGHLPFSSMFLKKRMRDYIIAELKGCKYSAKTGYHYTVLTRGTQTLEICLIEKNAWGTLEETLRVFHELQKRGLHEITVFSSQSHEKRVLETWRRLAPEITVTFIASDDDMNETLVSHEEIKSRQTEAFYFIYKHFGETALWCASWVKNLVLNVLLNRDKR